MLGQAIDGSDNLVILYVDSLRLTLDRRRLGSSCKSRVEGVLYRLIRTVCDSVINTVAVLKASTPRQQPLYVFRYDVGHLRVRHYAVDIDELVGEHVLAHAFGVKREVLYLGRCLLHVPFEYGIRDTSKMTRLCQGLAGLQVTYNLHDQRVVVIW